MIIDGPREMERLGILIEQIGAALQRLSSGDALLEVRGLELRELQDNEPQSGDQPAHGSRNSATRPRRRSSRRDCATPS
jgi:hypothetical protein